MDMPKIYRLGSGKIEVGDEAVIKAQKANASKKTKMNFTHTPLEPSQDNGEACSPKHCSNKSKHKGSYSRALTPGGPTGS